MLRSGSIGYVVQLVVNDGTSNSDPAIVTLSTTSTPPTANAGQNQLASVGTAVQLDGSRSIDPDGNPITYAWSILSAPKGSAASISDTTMPLPSFTPDLPGSYVVQLIVTDKNGGSTPSTVTISTTHIPPIANAGNAQSAPVGTTVVLDASLSTDPSGLPLTYSWALISKPVGSNATLSDQTAVHPTFLIDVSGIYVAQLVVNDALGASLPVTVGIFTGLPLPLANAGPNQTVQIDQSRGVGLDGSGSTDYGPTVVYSWSILYQPQGSTLSVLSYTNIANPAFSLYNKGIYVVQLITGDGVYRGLASTVVINVLDKISLNDLGVGNESYSVGPVEPHAAGTPGEVITITSTDPTHFLFSASPTQIGVATLTISLAFPPPFITVQGQNFSGTAPITATYTASAPGYVSGTAKLTLVPTGWFFYPPGPQTTTLFGAPLTLGPILSTLDPATLAGPPFFGPFFSPNIPLGPQAGTVSIPITSSNPAVGTLSSGVFRPLAIGTTVVTMTEPPGYSTPSNEPLQTTVTVNQDQISVGGDTEIGNNSMAVWEVYFSGPPPTAQTVTITSSDPTHFLLSASPTTVGTASIVIPLRPGTATGSLSFYVQGQNLSGTTPITGYLTTSASNYLSERSEAITLYPTALVPRPSAETINDVAALIVYLARLNPDLTSTQEYVPIGPQAPATPVAATSSNPSVVGITGSPSSFVFVDNTFALVGIMVPSTPGTATITVIEPPGYFTPSDGSNQIVITTTSP